MANGCFSTPVGTYGPFQVTDPGAEATPYPVPNISRIVTVPDATEAGGTDSFTLPFTMGYVQPGYEWASVQFNWQTDYDASQMYVSLWDNPSGGSPVCMWSQTLSGAQASTPTLDLSAIDFNYYFLVTVVPEPSALLCLAVALTAAAGFAARRSLCHG